MLHHFVDSKKKTDLVYGEGRGVDVGQPPDVVPSLLAVLVLHVGREVAEDQAVHLDQLIRLRSRFANKGLTTQLQNIGRLDG